MKKHLLTAFFLTILGVVNSFGQIRINFTESKFKTGDASEWKAPGFDDEGWASIKFNGTWESQGYPNYDGYAFYRVRFVLPSEMLAKASRKDSLVIYLGKIDDADEAYLNGKLIGKTGRFPSDIDGYASEFPMERFYKVATGDPAVLWDKENVLAIKVYDDNDPGGMYEGIPYVRMVSVTDQVAVNMQFGREKQTDVCSVSLVNKGVAPISGKLTIELEDTNSEVMDRRYTQHVRLTNGKPYVKSIPYPNNERYRVIANFEEAKTNESTSTSIIAPYLLTPKAPEKPQINGAKVFGIRPGSPFLFKIAASGIKPMKYSVEDLPEGLSVDPESGVITGVLKDAGEYKMTFVAMNAKGADSREFTVKVGDLLSLTPPMGWNSWNCWGLSVSDEKVRSSAQALIEKRLIDYGWTYINVDDAWQNDERDADGTLRANSRFPDMKGLGDWLHSQGLKFGVYSSPGPHTCGKYLGSYGYEKQDADMWADWGVDFIKYDWCDYWRVYDREGDRSLSAHLKPYQVMEKALKEQPRDIVYSLCQYGMRDVWEWGAAVDGNLWRTTGDIVDTWTSLKDIGFGRQAGLDHFAKPGRWNDPDMLIVGKVGWGDKLRQTRLSYDEQYTHISLWSLMASPLLIGCDISQLDEFTLSLLTNAEVIAVNQDVLGKQARRVVVEDGKQIFVKPLEDGSHAVGIFNLSSEDQQIAVKWTDLNLPETVNLRDLWRQKELGKSVGTLETKVPSHGVKLFRVY